MILVVDREIQSVLSGQLPVRHESLTGKKFNDLQTLSNRLLELEMEDMELSSEQFIILITWLSRNFIQRKRLRGKGKSLFINLNHLLMKTSFALLLPIIVITVPRIVFKTITSLITELLIQPKTFSGQCFFSGRSKNLQWFSGFFTWKPLKH